MKSIIISVEQNSDIHTTIACSTKGSEPTQLESALIEDLQRCISITLEEYFKMKGIKNTVHANPALQ